MLNQNDVFIEEIKLRHRHQAHCVSCVLEKKESLFTDIGTRRRVPRSRKQNALALWSVGLWVRDWRVTWLSTTIFVFFKWCKTN